MAAAYKRFCVRIPEDNGYANNPNQINERVLPHLKQSEPYAELNNITDNEWLLSTPYLGAETVANLLQNQYGFVVTEKDIISK